jgi:arylsulfatase A-like enzyme
VNLQGTHFPYATSPEARRPYRPDDPNPSTFTYLRYPKADREKAINRYDNALAHVDDQLRRIMGFLDERDQLSNTLWVVTSDHGELFFHKGLVTHGRTLDEAESRVPLLIHWPEGIAPKDRDEPVSHLDILPTLLDLLQLPPHPAFQGRSFASPLAGSVKPAIFLNIQGLRFSDAIICWPYKYLVVRERAQGRLFRLDSDPDERKDLSERLPAVRDALARTLAAQFRAQERYHAPSSADARRKRYQPRLLSCPAELPAKASP